MGSLIQTEEELDERLSRPSDADCAALASMPGDLLILGCGGKMGPSLATLAARAAKKAGIRKRIIAVARFTNRTLISALESSGSETISCDLLEPGALAGLPDVPNVIFMAARKFGTQGSEYLTWAINTYLPGLVAERYSKARIVVFSTGNVYPLRSARLGGADESLPMAPEGEYAQSAIGRERMFEYGSFRWSTAVTILRLNYAVEMRYGVLLDIGRTVFEARPVDVTMGLVNVVWQRDANSICLRAFEHCQSPPTILNVTGPEVLSIRYIANRFGEIFGIHPVFTATEAETALLSNATKAHQLFGYPTVTVGQMIDWTANWILQGGSTLNKPTHFDVRTGKF